MESMSCRRNSWIIWRGYRQSAPVRIGNGAVNQFQVDIYGELMDSVYLFNKYGTPIAFDFWEQLHRLLDWVCDHWQDPDEGIWETRGGRKAICLFQADGLGGPRPGAASGRKAVLPGQRGALEDRAQPDLPRNQCSAAGAKPNRPLCSHYGSDTLDASALIHAPGVLHGP